LTTAKLWVFNKKFSVFSKRFHKVHLKPIPVSAVIKLKKQK